MSVLNTEPPFQISRAYFLFITTLTYFNAILIALKLHKTKETAYITLPRCYKKNTYKLWYYTTIKTLTLTQLRQRVVTGISLANSLLDTGPFGAWSEVL